MRRFQNYYFLLFSKMYAQSLWKTIITVARCILLKLTGKYNSYVSDLEEQMNAVLKLDTVLQSITIWTVESNMAKAKQILEKNLEKVIAQLENEVHEETIVGSTRALFGKGASLQNL